MVTWRMLFGHERQHHNKNDLIVIDRNEKICMRTIRRAVPSPFNDCEKDIDRKESTHDLGPLKIVRIHTLAKD
jgi:hypothetical protein